METIIVNEAIKLVPYFENYDTTLKWYEDKDVCKQVDNMISYTILIGFKKCTITWILMESCSTLNTITN